LTSVIAQESPQQGDLIIAGSVGMDADCPHPGGFYDRHPKLLRNPGDAAAKVRPARISIRESKQTFGNQRPDRVRIESVARSDEYPRFETLFAQDAKALANPCSLGFWGNTG
jgi:hypothetical protein